MLSSWLLSILQHPFPGILDDIHFIGKCNQLFFAALYVRNVAPDIYLLIDLDLLSILLHLPISRKSYYVLCYVLKHLWQGYNCCSFTYNKGFCSLQFSSDLGIQQGTPKFQRRSIKTKEETSTWITTRQAKVLQSCSHF